MDVFRGLIWGLFWLIYGGDVWIYYEKGLGGKERIVSRRFGKFFRVFLFALSKFYVLYRFIWSFFISFVFY